MPYDGYWALGDTEIINSARTAAYVGNLLPTFGLKDCTDCDGLASALGAEKVYGEEERILPGTVVRRNYARNSKPFGGVLGSNVVDFAAYVAGPGETGTTTTVGANQDGPLMPDGSRLPYASRLVTAPKTSASTGWQATAFNYRPDVIGLAGDKVTISLWIRYTGPGPLRIRLRNSPYAVGGSNSPGFTDSDFYDLKAREGEWLRMKVTHAALTDFVTVGWWAYMTGASAPDQIPQAGSRLDVSGLLIEVNNDSGDYFDGDTFDTLEVESSWTGVPDRSGSVLMTYETTVPLLSDTSYRTPTLDMAPWIDTSNPALDGFWGFYPLNISGVDDGTREVAVTQLISDGAVVSLPRSTSREMRFEGVLLGKDKQAVTEGLHWLNRALDAYRCGSQSLDCTGTPLSFFSACPPACDYSACPDSPVEWEWVAERVNWISNSSPDPSSTGGNFTSVNGATVTVPSYGVARAEWSGTNTFGQTGMVYTETVPFQDIVGGPKGSFVPSGTPVSAMIDYISVSRPELQVQVFIQLRNGSTVVQSIPAQTLQGQTDYFGVTVEGLSTVAFNNFRVLLVIANVNTPVQAGDYLVGTRWMFETAPSGKPWFNGWTIDPSHEVANVWYGDQEDAPSVRYAAPDDASRWSITPPSVGGSYSIRWGQQWDGCPAPWNAGLRLSAPNLGADIVATRTLDGLIPGQWYKVDIMAVPSNGNGYVMSVRGTNATLNVPYGFSQCGNTTAPANLWFQATGPVMFLDLRMAPDPSDPRDQFILVRRLNISRATADFNVYQTQFPDDGSVLNGWSVGNISTDFRFEIERGVPYLNDVDATQLSLLAVVPPKTTTANQTLIQRNIRGLEPGREYVARMSVIVGAGFVSPAPVTLALAVNGLGQSTYTENWTQFGDSILIEHRFVATAEQHLVSLRLVNTWEVKAGGLQLRLLSFSMEREEAGAAIPYPDASLDYRRNLYQVTALTGPTVLQEFDMDEGAMMRVSFGLVAGVPHQFGPLKSAGSALGGSSSPLQNIECLYGEPVRVNLATNPSFETNTTGWSAGNATLSRQIGGGMFGLYRARLASMISTAAYMETTSAQVISVVAGNTYTASIYARGTVTRPVRVLMSLEFYDASNLPVGTVVFNDYAPLTADYSRYSVTALAPAGAVTVRSEIVFAVTSGVNFGAGDLIDVDAFQVEIGGAPTPYFDGSRPGAAWNGAANASSSTYTPREVSDLVDPDCPPLPSPPGPPPIPEECVEDPTAWTRYTIDIPGTAIPRFSSVLPVVTLRTGAAEARQVRMRWYPNPEGKNITELPACDYEGEIIVSYMPGNAEMVVDTITRQATASVNNGPEQQASQLLYGPDGGPMVWPELRCNQAYIFTVDVDSAASVDELDVLLSLGLKV